MRASKEHKPQQSRVIQKVRLIQRALSDEAKYFFEKINQANDYDSLAKYIKELQEKYFPSINSCNIIVLDYGNDHAGTSGHFESDGIKDKDTRQIKFNVKYLHEMAKTGTDESYAKLIGTLRHELVHYVQRADPDYRTKTTKEEREFLAYSEELIDQEGIPILSGEYRTKTKEKANAYYNKLTDDLKEKYKFRYNNTVK